MSDNNYIHLLARLSLAELQMVKEQVQDVINSIGTPKTVEDEAVLKESKAAMKLIDDEILERDWK